MWLKKKIFLKCFTDKVKYFSINREMQFSKLLLSNLDYSMKSVIFSKSQFYELNTGNWIHKVSILYHPVWLILSHGFLSRHWYYRMDFCRRHWYFPLDILSTWQSILYLWNILKLLFNFICSFCLLVSNKNLYITLKLFQNCINKIIYQSRLHTDYLSCGLFFF